MAESLWGWTRDAGSEGLHHLGPGSVPAAVLTLRESYEATISCALSQAPCGMLSHPTVPPPPQATPEWRVRLKAPPPTLFLPLGDAPPGSWESQALTSTALNEVIPAPGATNTVDSRSSQGLKKYAVMSSKTEPQMPTYPSLILCSSHAGHPQVLNKW